LHFYIKKIEKQLICKLKVELINAKNIKYSMHLHINTYNAHVHEVQIVRSTLYQGQSNDLLAVNFDLYLNMF